VFSGSAAFCVRRLTASGLASPRSVRSDAGFLRRENVIYFVGKHTLARDRMKTGREFVDGFGHSVPMARHGDLYFPAARRCNPPEDRVETAGSAKTA